MAVQIPRIEANNEDQLHDPRLQAPPLQTNMQQPIGALEQTTSDVIKYQKEAEYQQADTTATNAKNEYLIWRKRTLYGDPNSGEVGLLNKKGDPQDIYKEFDKANKDKLDELSKGTGDLSPMAQNIMNRRLSRAHEESQLETLTQYHNQKRKFDDQVSDDGIALNKNGMHMAATFVDPKEPDSTGPLDAKIADMRRIRIEQGKKYGGAMDSDDGDTEYIDGHGNKQKAKVTPHVITQMNDDVSEGLRDTITNLVHSKSFDKAAFLREKYDHMLSADDRDKLDNVTEKSKKQYTATQIADEAMKKGGSKWIIANYEGDDRMNGLRALHDEHRYVDDEQSKKSKDNFNTLANHLQEVQQSDKPYVSLTQLHDDSKYKMLIDNIKDSKQRKAIDGMIAPPKTSDPKASMDMMDFATGNNLNGNNPDGKTLRGMPANDFQLNVSHLKDGEQKYWKNQYLKANQQTDPQKESQVKLFDKELLQQGNAAGTLRYMPGSNTLQASSQTKLNQWRDDLFKQYSDYGPTSPKERKQIVADYIASQKGGQQYKLAPRQFNGGQQTTNPGSAPNPTPSPGPSPSGGISPTPSPSPTNRYGSFGNANGPLTKDNAQKMFNQMNRMQRNAALTDYHRANNTDKSPPVEKLMSFVIQQAAEQGNN